MTESQFQNKIVKFLKDNDCFVTKIHRASVNGIPDLLVLTNVGRMFFVEVKSETGRLSEIQKHTHKVIESKNGVVFTLSPKDDWKSILGFVV